MFCKKLYWSVFYNKVAGLHSSYFCVTPEPENQAFHEYPACFLKYLKKTHTKKTNTDTPNWLELITVMITTIAA